MSNDFFRTLTNDTNIEADIITCNELNVNNDMNILGDLKINGELQVDSINTLNNTYGINILKPIGVMTNATPTYSVNISGNLNLTGNGYIYLNGAPLAFSGSNWTPYGTGIYRNSNVGIGQFVTGNLIYDLQLGQIGTTLPKDKTISIGVAFDRNAKVRLSECGPSATETEAGFDIQLNGVNNRLEILSGSNATPAGQAFTTRSISIDRTTGYVSVGSAMDFTQPFYAYGGATLSRQARFQGASNASIQVQGFSGSLEMCVSNATGNFSINSNRYDSVIRSMTGTRLMFQSGDGHSALLIDRLNNVGVGVASNLSALTVSGAVTVTNNNIFILGNTSGVQLGPSSITIKNGLFNDNTLNGLQIFANNNQALRIDSNANVSVGGTNPVTGQRLRIDGNLNVQGGQYLLNGVTLNTSNIPEGSNLYYTDSRARQAISVSSSSSISLTYNNALGVISASIASTAGYSNWTLDGNNNIYRNSLVGINTTFVNTTHALSIGLNSTYNKGIYIESNYIGTDEQILRYKNINGGVDYYQNFDYLNGFENHVLNLSAGLYNNFGVDKDNYFYTRNPNGGGIGMKFYSPTMGATQGATIFYEGGANGALNIIHGDSGGPIELWTNINGTVDERWRISASGSFNNVKSSTETNALRVSGNIFFDNGETRINNLILTGNSIVSSGSTSTLRLFVTGSSGLTIDSLNNISCSAFNFGTLRPQEIFALPTLGRGLSYLSVSFFKVYTTSNMFLNVSTNCYTTIAPVALAQFAYLHSATGAYMGRLMATQYDFSMNQASAHYSQSWTRICKGITAGTYTCRFLYSGSGISGASSNNLYAQVTEVPL